jgi:regulator of PEP synthase PpsR (kinase-PPPase family)
MMQRLKARIAKQLAEFRESNAEPDYEEQARIIMLIVNEERLAEIREWRERRVRARVER